jgi:hypothetical protein
MGMLLALGLGTVGVAVGSVALNRANDNEDMITDLRVVPLEDPTTTEDPLKNEDPITNEDPTPVFLGGSPTLQAITDRSYLKCAVVISPGFTALSDSGELYGVDIDIVSSC